MPRWLRRILPFAVGVATALVASLTLREPQVPDALFTAAATVLSLLSGFLLAVNTMLHANRDAALVRRLRESGFLSQMRRYHSDALLAAFVGIPLTLFCIAAKSHTSLQPLFPSIFAIWSGVYSAAFLSVFRVMRLHVVITEEIENTDDEIDEPGEIESSPDEAPSRSAPPALPEPKRDDLVRAKKTRTKSRVRSEKRRSS